MSARAKVHMAGRVLGAVQYCAQCGCVLVAPHGERFRVGEHIRSSPCPHAGRLHAPTDEPVDCHR